MTPKNYPAKTGQSWCRPPDGTSSATWALERLDVWTRSAGLCVPAGQVLVDVGFGNPVAAADAG